MKASCIFEPEPSAWGLRGDPYFWRYLKERLADVDLPLDPDRLEKFIRSEHLRLSGKPMVPKGIAVAERFAHGGMSSGGLYGSWWLEKGIPLLRERLEQMDREITSPGPS